jgi:RNA polymerase sigma-32 factor
MALWNSSGMTKARTQPSTILQARNPSAAAGITAQKNPAPGAMARQVIHHETIRPNASLSHVARGEPLLSRQEEQELAQRVLAGDEAAARRLIISHLRFVIGIARRYRRTGLPLADLVQEGTIGLIQAVRRFRPERGVRLSTYAMWSIRAAIQDYVVRSWSAVRVGTTAKQKSLFFSLSRLLSGEAAALEARLTEFARRSGNRMTDILTVARRLAARDQSLDTPLRGTEGRLAGGNMTALVDERPDPETQLVEASERRLIAAVIAQGCAKLAPRELHIIRRRYLAQASVTLEAVARELDLSKERVRQLEKQALAKLRDSMRPQLRQGLVNI